MRKFLICFALINLLGLPFSPTAKSFSKEDSVIGRIENYTIRPGDTLVNLAPQLGVGYVELRAANPGLHSWVPDVGGELIVPTMHILPPVERRGLVVNLGDQRLYYFPSDGRAPQSFPIGTGRPAWETPLGDTKIVGKRRNPTWIPPESIRRERPNLPAAVPPGPENPLGSFALNLRLPGYVIHGTNRSFGIGRRISHGCIRMYPRDIEALFAKVSIGTAVRIINYPVKLGWSGGTLYLEAHPTQAQADEIETSGTFTPASEPEIIYKITRAAGSRKSNINWLLVNRILEQRRGIPYTILR